MKASTKRFLNYGFILLTLFIVLYIGISGNELSGLWDAMTSVSPLWLLVCFLLVALFTCLDAMTVFLILRPQGYKVSFRSMLFITIIGMYYSNLTPSASGGQPMQVYYMKKRDVPIGIGSSALTVKFFCFQFMLMIIGTIFWLVNKEYIFMVLNNQMWILVLGYIFNSISVTFVVMLAISRRMVRLLIIIFIKIGTLLHICKDPKTARARWEKNLSAFHTSIIFMLKHPRELIIQLAISSVQVIVWAFIPTAVYYAFGMTGIRITELVTIAILLYISASYTPLPGGSGAQEGFFAIYFAHAFPQNTLFVALLIWRFFTFYLSLIAGAILTIFSVKKKKEPRPKNEDLE